MSLESEIAAELAALAAANRLRSRPKGSLGIDFCSNDYLGLAGRAELMEAGLRALQQAGAGARAARLLGGGGELQAAAERAAAGWLSAKDALLFPSGYQANLGLIGALADRRDGLVCDELLHASLIDAARLSRAQVEVVPHGDLAAVEAALERLRGARRRFVLTEGVFSMDGDRPALIALARLAERWDAWLLIDEAHSAGLLGPAGAGAWEEVKSEAPARVLARLVTGGKSLGVAGALVVANQPTIELLVNRARSFIFTTAPPPALAGMLARAIELQPSLAEAREKCLALAQRLWSHLTQLSQRLGQPAPPRPAAAIVPWVLGDETSALAVAAAAQAAGFDVRAVRPPTVPIGGSRLRLVTHAHNEVDQIDALAEVLGRAALKPSAGTLRIAPLKVEIPRAAASAGASPERSGQSSPGRPLFVVGTDTGIGKTVGSGWALHALARRGPVAYWKPVQTGSDSDTQTLRELLAGEPNCHFNEPLRHYALPAAPDQAARAEGQRVPTEALTPHLQSLLAEQPARRLVVELAGGLLVPYLDDWQQIDWLASLRGQIEILLVARSGLGTLNHTQLSLEALRRRGLEPRALLLVGEPHQENRDYLERTSGVRRIHALPPLLPLNAETLAAASRGVAPEELLP